MAKQTPSSNPTPTQWTLILRAQGSGVEARAALGDLLKRYEGFIVWVIRRRGHPPDVTADDLKQEFLTGVLRRDDIAKLDRTRGSFRAWLGQSIRYFLCNEWDKWRKLSDGRGITDATHFEAIQSWTPEDDVCTGAFTVHTIVHVLTVQRAEARDKELFDQLARFLPGPQLDLVELAPFARSLGTTRGALAKRICLMRARFRELLRASVEDTLDLEPDPEHPSPAGAAARAIDIEMQALLEALEQPRPVGVVLEPN
jgi:DNA-directed RNA polymerase specialized sigma24 family protein